MQINFWTALAYYFGLVVLAALMHLPSYFSSNVKDRLWSRRIITAGILYLCLGWWVFGWKLGLANVAILLMIANLVVLPLDWIVHFVHPNVRYRMAMSRDAHRKMRRAAQKLGINRGNRPITPVRNRYPEDDLPN